MVKRNPFAGFGITDDVKQCLAMVVAVGNQAATLMSNIHITAQSCLLAAVAHGDTMPAQRLYEAVTAGARRDALVKWLCAFGPFGWVQSTKDKAEHFSFDKERCVAMRADYLKDADAFKAALAKQKPWHEYTPEPKIKPFDLSKELHKLIARARNVDNGTAKSAKHPESKVDKGLLRKLAQLDDTAGATVH